MSAREAILGLSIAAWAFGGCAPEKTCEGLTPFSPCHEWTDLGSEGTAIEGFTVPWAATPGESLPLFVLTGADRFDYAVFRLGEYGGAGAAFVERRENLPAPGRMSCGLVARAADCGDIPAAEEIEIQAHWPSGVYAVKLSADGGRNSFVPFVVRSAQPARYVAMLAVTTLQAYNSWGGKSLYGFNSTDGKATPRVSFRRPYASAAGLTRQLVDLELPMIRFLDSHYGTELSYVTDFELHRGEVLGADTRALLILGHDEYWTLEMREHVDSMLASGRANLGLFGANSAYWQVRLEAAEDGTPDVWMACHRTREADPTTDPTRATIRWRDLGRPENALFGVMYVGATQAGETFPMLAANADHPLMRGTGLKNGDSFGPLIGLELDGLVDNGSTPPGIELLASSPFQSRGQTMMAHAVYHVRPGGSKVFAAGSLHFPLGLAGDHENNSEALRVLTRNVVDDLGR